MRYGPDHTMGWSMMTPEERRAHQAAMGAMTSGKQCRAYVAQHHQMMQARAKARGATLRANPRRDPCAGLKD